MTVPVTPGSGASGLATGIDTSMSLVMLLVRGSSMAISPVPTSTLPRRG